MAQIPKKSYILCEESRVKTTHLSFRRNLAVWLFPCPYYEIKTARFFQHDKIVSVFVNYFNVGYTFIFTFLFWIKLFFFLFTTLQITFAQIPKNDSLKSQLLEEVEVKGMNWEKYALATKSQTADSLYIAQNPAQNVGDWLLHNTPAYIKQYGNGMLGSISLRGTGASHTSVVWNGIAINSLTLGESDFGNIPLNNTQKLTLHYGGASVWQGSEAIGGVLAIDQNPSWDNRKKVSFLQSFGSFGQRFSQFQSSFSAKKWELQNTFSTQFVENNFPFYNKTLQNSPLENQQNASWTQHGFTQDVYFKPNKSTLFGLKLWGQMRHQHIQPTMSANQDQSTWATQRDNNLRILAEMQKHFSKFSLYAKQAYIYDYLLFNEQQKTATYRFVTQIKAEKNIKNITLQFGVNNTLIRTEVEAYRNQIWENRTDFFAYLLHEVSKKYQISVNIRQNMVNQTFNPITPNFSQQYFLIKNENKIFSIKNSFSRNYKVPTLNDRYWAGSANPNLRPENAWSGELGLLFVKNYSNIQFSLENTYYQMYVEDWIIWLPKGSVWQPENRRKVEVKGFETSFKMQKTKHFLPKNQKDDEENNHESNKQNRAKKAKEFDFSFCVQYAFTQSLNRENAESSEYYLDKKQLPYTPTHRWSGNFLASYQQFFVNVAYQYTGTRYETLDNADTFLGRLMPFQTMNLNVGKNFYFNQKNKLSIDFQIRNLLNEDYQNYLFRAMPLRSYTLNLKLMMND